MFRPVASFSLLACGMISPLMAKTPVISVDQLTCIPMEENSAVRAHVQPERGGDTVRLYFRRLHHVVEDFYFVHMEPDGDGEYWGVLPKPHDRRLKKNVSREGDGGREPGWADWWLQKEASKHRNPNGDLDQDLVRERASVGKLEPRDWMNALSPRELQNWLGDLENEPAEYFAAVFDSHERFVTKSQVRVTRVTSDCPLQLNAEEAGTAQVLAVGETAPWQVNEPVFHWKCDGLVTRIGTYDQWLLADLSEENAFGWEELWEKDQLGQVVLDSSGEQYRADGVCKACVFVVPLWAAGLVGASSIAAAVEEGPPTDSAPQ